MSRTRSWTSKHPGRICVYSVGSRLYSSGGQPATAFEPDVGRALALELPDVTAAVGLDDARDAVGVLRRPMLREHAAGLDDVVVDADQDEVLGVHGLLLHTISVGTINT